LPIRRRPKRYSADVYRIENKPLSVTVCLKQGTPAVLHHLADIVVEVMKEKAEKAHIQLHAYCLMPDHMHIICSVDTHDGDFPLFMRTLKREASRRTHKDRHAEFAWQRDYWDRFILEDESVIEAINYVLGNPVRKGLCERAEDWPASEYVGWAG
jgi:putative transposase